MAGTRVDMEQVSVHVDGIGDLGVFDTFAGGGVKGNDQKYRPGGMGAQVSLGSQGERDPITVGRLKDTERDMPLLKRLDEAARTSAPVSLVRVFLKADRTPAGDPISYTGTLISFTLPDGDSNSNDPAVFTLEVSADEAIS